MEIKRPHQTLSISGIAGRNEYNRTLDCGISNKLMNSQDVMLIQRRENRTEDILPPAITKLLVHEATILYVNVYTRLHRGLHKIAVNVKFVGNLKNKAMRFL